MPFDAIPHHLQDYKDGRIRQEAVGCMAEVVEALGENVAPKLDV